MSRERLRDDKGLGDVLVWMVRESTDKLLAGRDQSCLNTPGLVLKRPETCAEMALVVVY